MIRAGRELGNASSMFGHAVAERLGIAPADWECLVLLFEHGTMPAGRLAELTGLSTGAITGLVDRLVAAGFVTRRRDRNDRRRVFVELVAESTDIVQPVCDPMLAELVELHARYSDEEVALVVKALLEGAEVVRRHAVLVRSATQALVETDRTGSG